MKKIVFAIVCAALMFCIAGSCAKEELWSSAWGSADAGKLDPHIASTTPDKGVL